MTLIKIILTFLDKLYKEIILGFHLGGFKISLLNCNDHQPANEYLDSFASNSFIPYNWKKLELLINQKPSLIIFSHEMFMKRSLSI